MDFKHLIFNEDEKPNPRPIAIPSPTGFAPVLAGSTVPMTSATYPIPTVVPDGHNTFLDNLKAKTDFDSTPIGQQVREHMVPLDGLPLTEAQKFSAVLKAGAKDGLTGASIVQALQALLAALDQDKTSFDTAIGAKQTAAKAIEDKIADARKTQDDLTTQLVTARSTIESKTAQYQAAYDARKTELQDKINHFSSLLTGAA